MQPQRRDSCAVGKVCSYAEEIRIKPLETVGVVRDNALTGQVEYWDWTCYPTYQDLAARTSPKSLGAGVLLLFSKTYHIGQIYVSHRSMILGEMALRGV
jgi:hypothetical protein